MVSTDLLVPGVPPLTMGVMSKPTAFPADLCTVAALVTLTDAAAEDVLDEVTVVVCLL